MFCSEHVVQLHRKQEAIHRAGAELHVIGNGRTSFIEGFRDKTGFDGPMYVDPSLESYRALGFRRGVVATFHPRGVLQAVRAMRRGHRQTANKGDPWQQGGTVVVYQSGEVGYVYRSKSSGDLPGTRGVLAALS